MTIQLTWTGADGTVWPLGLGNPVFTDGRGVEGLGNPAWVRNTQESAGRDGQRRTGLRSRAQPREGFLPVAISPIDPAGWMQLQRSWWNSWSPDVPGTLSVTAPDGSVRSITCYLKDEDKYAPVLDPSLIGFERIGVSWVADDPWWYGPTTTQVYSPNTGVTDFLNGGAAPPLVLTSETVSGSMVLANYGDMPGSPVYTMTPGVTAFSVTIDGHTVAGSIPVPGGSRLVIDPYMQSAVLIDASGNVTSVASRLSAIDFSTLAVGSTSSIAATLTGTGTLSISFAPRFKRAL